MYCLHCGRMIKDEAAICPYCAGSVKENVEEQEVTSKDEYGSVSRPFVLGLVLPIVGFALYFAWRSYREKQAKAALLGSVITTVILIMVLSLVAGF